MSLFSLTDRNHQLLEDESLIGTDAWKDTKAILEQTVQRELDHDESSDQRKTSDWKRLLNLLMQLKKISSHPYQLSNAEPNPYEYGDHVITASGKFIVLEKLVNELVIKQKKKICKHRLLHVYRGLCSLS